MRKYQVLLLFSCALLVTSCGTTSSYSNSLSSDSTVLQVFHLEKEALVSEYIEWYGRHESRNESEYFYHTATGFKISFFGRALDVNISLENRKNDIVYSVAKDGEDLLNAPIFVQNATTSLQITFETFGQHTVEIVKRSEPEDGVTSLKSVTTNGYFTPVVKKDKSHFLLVGASGISGHGALGKPGEARTTLNSSSLHSFGYLSAHHFDASFEFVANSGWGIKYGFNDLSGVTNLYEAYDKVGIDANEKIVTTPYLHEKKADYIIVNAGGNDYSAVINKASGFDKEEKVRAFKSQVANMLLKFRADHPAAHIMWTMTAGSLNGTAASQVIAQFDVSDQQYMHIVIIEDVASNGDLAGANNHASYITHQRSAANIINEINKYI